MRITAVSLYDCAANPNICMDDVASFIRSTFDVSVQIRSPPHLSKPDTDACRVRNLFRPPDGWGDADECNTEIYDGYLLADVLGRCITHSDGTYHVLFVDDLVGTYDYDGMKYHGRAIISANPGIISVQGICTAPARPRQYYVDMMACAAGGDTADVESRHAGAFLTPDDGRLGDVVCGYVMQAIFHFETGEAFCDDAGCRLFNSHWQSDLIRTQIESPRLCERHRAVLDGMR